jgi:2-polyprenyl-6-methoxyphenol hydroxylase-like FAD-dependent oxidoreductase
MEVHQGSSATRVLVAGAGPVGLTMAAALAKQGLTVRIIDKAPQASDKSKALVVWSRTLELLDKLDLADRFVEAGLPAEGVSIYGAGKRLMHIAVDNSKSPFARPLMLPQCETERLLAEHLTRLGLAVERGTELVSFVEQPDGIVATLRRDGQEEITNAAWLIGCDGAHSTVRHVLATPFVGTTEPSEWMLADVHLSGTRAKVEIEIYWHEKGILALFPITRDRYRMIADLGSIASAPAVEPTLADVQAKLDERGPGGIQASDPIWLANFRVNERKVSEYRHGRAFLAGDAAHIHSPAGGQGMNTGMQDAFNLAWKLALVDRGQAQAEMLLSSYSVERSKVGDQVLRGASLVTDIATLRNPLAQFVRNHTASLLGSFSFVRDKIRDTLGELSINYRTSPLSVEEWSVGRNASAPDHGTVHAGDHGTVRAGDRLPDAPLVDPASGQRVTLFDSTAGPLHTLILLAGDGSQTSIAALRTIAQQVETAFPDILVPLLIVPQGTQAATGSTGTNLRVRIDCEGAVCRQHGAHGAAVVVVRPDGYIGYRGQTAASDRLLAYLEKYLVRGTSAG